MSCRSASQVQEAHVREREREREVDFSNTKPLDLLSEIWLQVGMFVHGQSTKEIDF
jgi:hypothetical protein